MAANHSSPPLLAVCLYYQYGGETSGLTGCATSSERGTEERVHTILFASPVRPLFLTVWLLVSSVSEWLWRSTGLVV